MGDAEIRNKKAGYVRKRGAMKADRIEEKTAKPADSQRKPRRKIDRRILRTREALGDALVALMHEKNFEDITVQQVLDRADVARSTFYEHYRDKDDLFVSDVEDFLEMFSTALKRHGDRSKRLAPVREFFAHVREVREFYLALMTSGKLNEVQTLGRGILARSIDERLRMAGVETDAVRRAAQAHALAGSLFSLLDWWVNTGMKADPQEMDDLFHRMAWNGLAGR